MSKGITNEDRREMAQSMVALHQEINQEISKPSVEPARLMRLLGAGISQCLIAQAAMISPDALAAAREAQEEQGEDPSQLHLFDPGG